MDGWIVAKDSCRVKNHARIVRKSEIAGKADDKARLAKLAVEVIGSPVKNSEAIDASL